MPLPLIKPAIVNSANPWATTLDDLQALFDCPFTGGVTTRTSLLSGFEHDANVHQYTFFNLDNHSSKLPNVRNEYISGSMGGSLNTLGYSPFPLSGYLSMIGRVVADSKLSEEVKHNKPFIISVTGSSEAVVECLHRVQAIQSTITNPLCLEVNLSCPNIPDKPPPAYAKASLIEYLHAISKVRTAEAGLRVAVGIKTPPYTYHDQFQTLIDSLLAVSVDGCPIDFITATNTLGSCLVLGETNRSPALSSSSGSGIGGMAGAPLHPLALGNVKTIRAMLDRHQTLKGIDVIGVGGVSDKAGLERMQAVGAKVVGIGTALGREGVAIFERVWKG